MRLRAFALAALLASSGCAAGTLAKPPQVDPTEQWISAGKKVDFAVNQTKAMIQLACVSLLRCKHCVAGTVKKLKTEHKVSDQQIAEVMMVASFAAAGTNLAWAAEVFDENIGAN